MTEVEQLEQELACQAAKMDLASFCTPCQQDGAWWYNLERTVLADPSCVAKAVRYLELRQRLERNPLSPHLVRVVDQVQEKKRPSPLHKLLLFLSCDVDLLAAQSELLTMAQAVA